jgi:iron-sulfur cluster assembly accessory protein
VTPKAAATITGLIAEQRRMGVTEEVFLRVCVVPGGCQGFTHKLDLDLEVSPEDQVSESAGVKVVTFKRQTEMLRGCRVDYGEEDGREGFKIHNPNFDGESARKWIALLEKEKGAE